VRRRIAILVVAVCAMVAAPAGLSGASASVPVSNRTVLCVGNGPILGMSLCVPMLPIRK
jgi:hypothetical protein